MLNAFLCPSNSNYASIIDSSLSIGLTKIAVRSSLIPYAVLLMPFWAVKCIRMFHKHQQKTIWFWSSIRCVWIMHKCNFSHTDRKWISVYLQIRPVFPDLATYVYPNEFLVLIHCMHYFEQHEILNISYLGCV